MSGNPERGIFPCPSGTASRLTDAASREWTVRIPSAACRSTSRGRRRSSSSRSFFLRGVDDGGVQVSGFFDRGARRYALQVREIVGVAQGKTLRQKFRGVGVEEEFELFSGLLLDGPDRIGAAPERIGRVGLDLDSRYFGQGVED